MKLAADEDEDFNVEAAYEGLMGDALRGLIEGD